MPKARTVFAAPAGNRSQVRASHILGSQQFGNHGLMYSISQYRSIALGAVALFILVALIRSFQSGASAHLGRLPIHGWHNGGLSPINVTSKYVRIKKVTALFGENNHLYEAALETHQRHNEKHGYETQVLRQRITGNFLAKPAYILTTLVEELSKPVDERMHWLAWFDPDTIILNPQIPLELFLPPPEEEIHLVGTHDSKGFNGGVFFLRVDQWSLDFLIEVLAVPLMDNKHHVTLAKDYSALEQVLESPGFRGRTVYQPRGWFNAFDVNKTFEGEAGNMLVHFPDVSANKWTRMDMYLGNMSSPGGNPWEVPMMLTTYESSVAAYWSRINDARKLFRDAKDKEDDRRVHDTARRLRFVMDYETDHEEVMRDALNALRKALSEVKVPEDKAL